MRRYILVLAVLAIAAIGMGARRAPEVPQLGLPLACRLGQTCLVQNYVDADPGPAPHDYLCRGRTYQGHNGTDFRIQSLARMAEGVPVSASAQGRILRSRDGGPDVSMRHPGETAVQGEQCGNGLVVDDGDGWETQYCHLARGSIRLKPGQHVRMGAALGKIGLSGDTEFPHVHLTVRKDGHVIDPFAYGAAPGSCGGGRALWRDRVPYQSGEVLVAGFASKIVNMDDAQASGADQQPRPTRSSELIAFVQAIGLQQGDVQQLSIAGPDGKLVVANTSAPLDHDKAQTIMDVGRKPPAGGWNAGVYQASYAVRRAGVDVLLRTFLITL